MMIDHFEHMPKHFSGLDHKILGDMELVYLISASEGDLYKIGKTKCPKQRFSNIQTACPFEVSLIAGIRTPCAYLVESHYHKQLLQYRARGEWFKLPESVAGELSISFIESARSAREASSALL